MASLSQVAKNGLTQAPQGLWRSRMGNVVNGKNINAYWEVFSQDMNVITQEVPLNKVPGICWELTSNKSASKRNANANKTNIDTNLVHQWALNEGIISESSKIPTMPFPILYVSK